MTDEGGTTVCDLAALSKTAPTRRELAWELLKQTRNPDYVAMRYGYPVEKMRAALEKIPNEKKEKMARSRNRLIHSGDDVHSTVKRAGELLPKIDRRERVPGEDDDKK